MLISGRAIDDVLERQVRRVAPAERVRDRQTLRFDRGREPPELRVADVTERLLSREHLPGRHRDDEGPTGCHHVREVGDRRCLVFEMLDHLGAHDQIEASIELAALDVEHLERPEREPARVRLERELGDVHAGDRRIGEHAVQQLHDLAESAPGVEHGGGRVAHPHETLDQAAAVHARPGCSE